MGRRGLRRGVSLVEILIATALVAVTVVAYLTLTTSEIVWTQDTDDRAKAMSLARNLLALVEYGYRDLMREPPAAVPQGDGSFLVEKVHTTIPDGHLAMGGGLFDWVDEMDKRGGFQCTLRWNPAPSGADGKVVPYVGQATCMVRWRSTKGKERWIALDRLMTH